MEPNHDQNNHLDPLNPNTPFQIPNMPQVLHTPPQIFGGYGLSADGGAGANMEMNPDLLGPMFMDGSGNALGLMDESLEAKRRRIARACDMCRKKKIKCDGKLPSCTHCNNYKTECVFTLVEKKRNPPKGAKYIEGLENRLARMEGLLVVSGLLDEDDNGRTDLGTLERKLAEQRESQERRRASTAAGSHPASSSHGTPNEYGPSTPHSTLASPRLNGKSGDNSEKAAGAEKKEPEVEQLSDMMCSLVTNNCGETRYIGSSSGFSIFSPKGIQWVNEKTGDSSFQEMISSASVDENKWMYWKQEIFSDLFARRIFKQLPPKSECVSLLRDFFENFNCMFPLFHQPTFMHLVDRQYSRNPYEGSGWWASLNVALAIAHRLRVMSNLVPQEEDEKGWAYLKNAMAVVTELTMRNTDLLSVQALLGMALFLQGTPNPQPSFFLVAAAIRSSHSIGLHKRGSGFNLNPVEIEQRKRVFWIGYMVDKDLCLRSGRPPAQDDDDMNVELPSADPEDGIGNIPLADGKSKMNLFRLMCEFATIESKVYKQLYSTTASKQSDGELLNTIGELDRQLEEWKDSIPIDFRPEHEIKASHTPLILHVVVLHFAYYNCLTTIHRMSIHHGYWTSRLSNYAIQGLNARPLNPRVFSSAALCVSAARASIGLIKYVPQGDFACVWLILYFPVSALVTLFGNILQNPQDPRAASDVSLMSLVVSFLSLLATEEENGGVKRMLGVCSEFERIAKVVLEKAEKESSSRRKRKSHDVAMEPKTTAPYMPPNPALSAQTPLNMHTPGSLAGVFSPHVPHTLTPQNAFGPHNGAGSSNGASRHDSASPNAGLWADFSAPNNNPLHHNGTEYAPSHAPSLSPFPDMQGYGTGSGLGNGNSLSGLNMNTFQQPFVPQDLWQMPMTLEWDWADMTGGAYPSFENGIVGGGGGGGDDGLGMVGNGGLVGGVGGGRGMNGNGNAFNSHLGGQMM